MPIKRSKRNKPKPRKTKIKVEANKTKKIENDFLHSQLVRLGDMMGDGLHHEPDGRWITAEYKKILKALGMFPKRKRNTKQIDTAMIERIKKVKCQKCSGKLKQTRSGSMRGVCIKCKSKYQLLKNKRRQ